MDLSTTTRAGPSTSSAHAGPSLPPFPAPSLSAPPSKKRNSNGVRKAKKRANAAAREAGTLPAIPIRSQGPKLSRQRKWTIKKGGLAERAAAGQGATNGVDEELELDSEEDVPGLGLEVEDDNEEAQAAAEASAQATAGASVDGARREESVGLDRGAVALEATVVHPRASQPTQWDMNINSDRSPEEPPMSLFEFYAQLTKVRDDLLAHPVEPLPEFYADHFSSVWQEDHHWGDYWPEEAFTFRCTSELAEDLLAAYEILIDIARSFDGPPATLLARALRKCDASSRKGGALTVFANVMTCFDRARTESSMEGSLTYKRHDHHCSLSDASTLLRLLQAGVVAVRTWNAFITGRNNIRIRYRRRPHVDGFVAKMLDDGLLPLAVWAHRMATREEDVSIELVDREDGIRVLRAYGFGQGSESVVAASSEG